MLVAVKGQGHARAHNPDGRGNYMDEALKIRLQWMREYGIPEDEWQQILLDNPPVSVEKEQQELEAVRKVQELNKELKETKFFERLSEELRVIKRENGLPEDYKGIICTLCRKPVLYDEQGKGYCDHVDERPKSLQENTD
jgi:hypothetical protein